jgi:hypothetical protein
MTHLKLKIRLRTASTITIFRLLRFEARTMRAVVSSVGFMRALSLLLLTSFLHSVTVSAFGALSGEVSNSRFQQRRSTALDTASSETTASPLPVLVVGATGRVGRRVVQQLLAQNRPVRALVRNPAKAQKYFGTSASLVYPQLEIIVADVSRYEDYEEVLDRAVQGCQSIISVMGVVRFSRILDFVPWRIFRIKATWADRDHPYYGNYLAQKRLIELAGKHNVQRFVRLTGLGLAYSAFNPVGILFNTLLSCNNRYGILTEQELAKNNVPYVVLRPGGLANNARNITTTNLQVDASGKLPFPARVGRSDVAALAIAATEPGNLLADKSYTLACRWVGEGIKPKPQGVKEDGFSTAAECLRAVADSDPLPPPKMKPYALAALLTVYSLAAVSVKASLALWALTRKLILG